MNNPRPDLQNLSPQQKRELLARLLKDKIQESHIYPLSFAQERLWFLDRLEGQGQSATYNIQQLLKLSGTLNLEALEQAVNRIIQRHAVLRTVFITRDDQPLQQIKDPWQIKLTVETADPSQIQALAAREAQHPFDLAIGPLLRIRLIRTATDTHYLLLVMHHIVTDAWSSSIFFQEIGALYHAYSQGQPSPLPPLPLQYADYARQQRQQFSGDLLNRELQYWTRRLADAPPVLELPLDFPRPQEQSYRGGRSYFKLDATGTQRLKQLEKQTGTTNFMIILAAFSYLLSRLSGSDDILVGTPVANRGNRQIEPLIGFFVNTLVMRTQISAATVAQHLAQVRQTTLDAYRHQELPFEKLVEELHPERNLSFSPIFQVMLTLINVPFRETKQEQLSIRQVNIEVETVKFDLELKVVQTTDALEFEFEYCVDLFRADTIERFGKYFLKILDAFIADPAQPLESIDIIPSQERRQLLHEFNDTHRDFPDQKNYMQLFSDQVNRTPHRIAARQHCQAVTYSCLQQEAQVLSAALQAQGIGPGATVALNMHRGIAMLTAILAVFNRGAAYLPIDPDYPQERIDYILKDSNAALCLDHLNHREHRVHRGFLTKNPRAAGSVPSVSSVVQKSPIHPAYIIYTSGTTGKPKGVIIHQRGMINHLYAKINDLGITHTDIIAQTASACFDISVWQYLAALLTGGVTSIIQKETVLQAPEFLLTLQQQHITILESVPSLMTAFLESAGSAATLYLRWMIPTGEALSLALVNQWFQYFPAIPLVNAYGPTEASDDITHHFIYRGPAPQETAISIGKPLQNLHIYILDTRNRLCPIGVRGEICVAGIGVGPGYWNDKEKTDRAFIPNPLLPQLPANQHQDYARVYRTGDIGYYRPDGSLICLGRLDFQVKIRGNRIECGEIERQIAAHPGIKEVAVIARDDQKSGKYLCAYIVPPVEIEPLKKHLAACLPDYMWPSYYVTLDQMPVTANGKLDRKKLPPPQVTAPQDITLPRTETQQQLARIWAGELGVEIDAIGIDANFFQLGGHSLKAAVMISKIHKQLGVKVPLAEIFKRQTLQQLAAYIAETRQSRYDGIRPIETKEYYPLSSAQKRLYFLQRMDTGSTVYNLPFVLPLTRQVEPVQLEQCLIKLIRRHESLRTSFIMKGEDPVQRIHPARDISFQMEVLTCSLENFTFRDFVQPFNLEKAPLIRSVLVLTPEGESIWMVDTHHIVSDGTSHQVLARDFVAYYKGDDLPPLAIQYKDFSHWQSRLTGSPERRKQEEYWLRLFGQEGVGESDIPRLNLRTDRPRPEIFTYRGDRWSFSLDKEQTRALRQLAEKQGTTLYMNMLALLNLLFYKYTAQKDIIIGTVTAGRPHVDLQQLIGMFINTLPMRNHPQGDKSFLSLLEEVKATSIEALENQDLQFEELVETLNLKRDLSGNPLFDISLVVQNFAPLVQDPQVAQVLPVSRDAMDRNQYKNPVSRFDMTFFLWESPEDIRIEIEYYTAIFDAQTIQRLTGHLNHLIQAALAQPEALLKDLQLLSPAEREQQLYRFNRQSDEYIHHQTIHDFFRQQAVRTPHRIALVGETQLTYAELDRLSDDLAQKLRQEGVAHHIIALLLEPGCRMIVAILATLKAGAAYLPIDPNYPQDRIDYILKDSNAVLCIDHLNHRKPNEHREHRGFLTKNPRAAGSVPSVSSVVQKSPIHPAYIIYTSGTTGRPKGCLITHKNVMQLMTHRHRPLDYHQDDRWVMAHSYCFDFSVWEMYGAILFGGRLILPPRDIIQDPARFLQLIRQCQITILNQTPPAFYNLVTVALQAPRKDLDAYLRAVIFGGDKLEPSHLKPWVDTYPLEKIRLINMYGITETTVHVTHRTLTADDIASTHGTSPIGLPLPALSLYILNPHCQLQPVGIMGEIYVAGSGVSPGYLNRPELTTQRFPSRRVIETAMQLSNPAPNPETALYRTGDLGYWQPDGTVIYGGRIDHQVKIRGFRIEPAEIEKQILTDPGIREVFVTVYTKGQNPGLCAYIVPHSQHPLNAPELRRYLRQRLPEYMVPTYFVFLEAMPLTANNKINRQRLPDPAEFRDRDTAPARQPSDPVETQLVEIWAQVLGIPKENVRLDINFFDLGGHSFNLIKLSAAIKETFHKEIPLAELFRLSTIEATAAFLREETVDIQVSDQMLDQSLDTMDETLSLLGEDDND